MNILQYHLNLSFLLSERAPLRVQCACESVRCERWCGSWKNGNVQRNADEIKSDLRCRLLRVRESSMANMMQTEVYAPCVWVKCAWERMWKSLLTLAVALALPTNTDSHTRPPCLFHLRVSRSLSLSNRSAPNKRTSEIITTCYTSVGTLAPSRSQRSPSTISILTLRQTIVFCFCLFADAFFPGPFRVCLLSFELYSMELIWS